MRVAVYLCSCSGTLNERIDLDQVAAALSGSPHEVTVRTVPLLCAEATREQMAAELAAERPERVVIGACSPREHEATFMRVMTEAGLNPYLMQLVNLREQIAWVTPDRSKATAKAITWLRGALNRVVLHQPLERREIDAVAAVLVIGAGPAGLKAALTLAASGRQVILVERSPVIGGLPVRFEELFPALECGPCLMEPILGAVLHGEQAERIELLTMAEVQEVVGFFGNFQVKIRQAPRHVDLERCIGCGECAAACPDSFANPFEEGLNRRKAIDLPFTGALPNVPTLERNACRRWRGEECELCRLACPIGDDLVRYDDEAQVIERQVGAIVVATGAALFDCTSLSALGYGRIPGVHTTLELERLLASSGPTGGELLTPAGTPPRAIAVIHCVGSRDAARQPYCSEVCCRTSCKYHQLLHHKLPEVKVWHFFRELVLPGKGTPLLCSEEELEESLIRYRRLDDLRVDPSPQAVAGSATAAARMPGSRSICSSWRRPWCRHRGARNWPNCSISRATAMASSMKCTTGSMSPAASCAASIWPAPARRRWTSSAAPCKGWPRPD
jgi:heterodisulfide reductase subunit A